MIDDEPLNENYRNFLRMWASITEHLYAFDPERVQKWFDGVKEIVQEPGNWPEADREMARYAHYSGAAMVATFRADYAQRILGHQDILIEADGELDDPNGFGAE